MTLRIGKQLLWTSKLQQLSITEDSHSIIIKDCGDTMGDGDEGGTGTVMEVLAQGFLDAGVSIKINVCGGFVDEEERGVGTEESTSQAQELSLTDREIGTRLFNGHLEFKRMSRDLSMHPGGL